jgi:hypothetical protein
MPFLFVWNVNRIKRRKGTRAWIVSKVLKSAPTRLPHSPSLRKSSDSPPRTTPGSTSKLQRFHEDSVSPEPFARGDESVVEVEREQWRPDQDRTTNPGRTSVISCWWFVSGIFLITLPLCFIAYLRLQTASEDLAVGCGKHSLRLSSAVKIQNSHAMAGSKLLTLWLHADHFQARSSDELSLAKGDRVELIERDDEFGDGWFLGKHLVNGNSGLFPEGNTSAGLYSDW